jgi:hypothetical protein
MKTRVLSADAMEDTIRMIFHDCDEIVLFGSRSSQPTSSTSDWDVLCISERRPEVPRHLTTMKGGYVLDLVWLTRDDLRSNSWSGSELANHIAKYGSWLRGAGDWRANVTIAKAAIASKRRRVEIRIAFQRKYGEVLLPPYRMKHFTLLRRELQRLSCLQRGIPVPPSPHLDVDWHKGKSLDLICRLANSFGFDLERNIDKLD